MTTGKRCCPGSRKAGDGRIWSGESPVMLGMSMVASGSCSGDLRSDGFLVLWQSRASALREEPGTLSSDHVTGEICLGDVEGFRCAVSRLADPREVLK